MCIFCKIANGEIPSYKVYENEDCLAFLDLSQATIGHTLVIPKKHFDNFLEMDSETAKKLFESVQAVAKKISKNLNCCGINIINNNLEGAGQTVMHAHVHIIPRYANDDFNIAFPENKLNENQFKELVEIIKK